MLEDKKIIGNNQITFGRNDSLFRDELKITNGHHDHDHG